MILQFRNLIICLIFLFKTASAQESELIQCKIYIKVLLEETETDKEIHISCLKGIKIKFNENQTKILKKIKINLNNKSIKINEVEHPSILIQNEQIRHLEFAPVNGYIKLADKEYQGSILILKSDNKFQIINKVELEDYIYSVLKTESWPGWPLEINKVLAIAIRSYAIAKFLESKNKLNYHIKNTNKHQTYTGVHNCHVLREATEQTKGIILAHKNKPILAMFDICCGGVIPAHMHNINFEHAPYLKRKKICNFCQSYKHYSWENSFNRSELEEILKKEIPQIKNLKRIIITKKDKAGIVKQLSVNDKKNSFQLNSKKFYSLLKIKSHCYTFIHRPQKIIIKGKGFGHHLGICQWGARKMVEEGWDHKSILEFYYPGANFMKLKKKIN